MLVGLLGGNAMTDIDYKRAAKYFFLQDFWVAFKLGMKYFFRPKATLNYPHEKLSLIHI